MGEAIRRRQRTAAPSPVNQCYQLWIDTYRSETRRQSVEQLVVIVNQRVSSIGSSEQTEELLNTFKQATEYECNFWIDAYNHA